MMSNSLNYLKIEKSISFDCKITHLLRCLKFSKKNKKKIPLYSTENSTSAYAKGKNSFLFKKL